VEPPNKKRQLIGLLVIVLAIAGFGWYQYTDGHVFGPLLGWDKWTNSGHAMDPTLDDGQTIWTEPLDGEMPSRGDIVVLRAPDGRTLVKRVAAIGGDTIETDDGVLLINGEPTSRAVWTTYAGPEIPSTELLPDTVYVLGDNLGGSLDSRSFGPVDVDDVLGVVQD
jgi:signal peptidase I